MASQCSSAGEVFFDRSVPLPRTKKLNYIAAGDRTGSLKLLRVQSAPTFEASSTCESSKEDVCWLRQASLWNSRAPLPLPPSATALKLLLEHVDAVNADLYGTGDFKSVHDLYDELSDQTSFIIKEAGSAQRYCEPVILQLSWNGYVLMKVAELADEDDAPLQKSSFIAARLMPGEDWRGALLRIVESDLHFPLDGFLGTLVPSAFDEHCHTVIHETGVSPSYPGLVSVYNSHMVHWEIQRDHVEFYKSYGLPVDPELIDPSRETTDFTTTALKQHRLMTYHWQWMPVRIAQQRQRFLNMEESTPDEKWAKHAFQSEGIVQCPPSKCALEILLRRCGIDIDKCSTDPDQVLANLWLELTTQASFLEMAGGQLVRLVDALVVRVLWRPAGVDGDGKTKPHKFLVEVADQQYGGGSTPARRLLATQKRRGETWEEAAVRCVAEALGLTPQQTMSLLAIRSGGSSGYMFHEEQKESESCPGLQCLHRTHLVTFACNEEVWSSPYAWALGLPQEEAGAGRASGNTRSASVDGCAPAPARLEWLGESEAETLGGAGLWGEAEEGGRHRISSVLLGLEGAAPGMKSPFGVEHDVSGASAAISAVGNAKWRTYRLHNALQIPSDEGGMRMNITRKVFEDLMEACDQLDLIDPGPDLADRGGGHPRAMLDRRFAEQEMFKRILASSGREARKVIGWMRDYRSVHKTPAQVYKAVAR